MITNRQSRGLKRHNRTFSTTELTVWVGVVWFCLRTFSFGVRWIELNPFYVSKANSRKKSIKVQYRHDSHVHDESAVCRLSFATVYVIFFPSLFPNGQWSGNTALPPKKQKQKTVELHQWFSYNLSNSQFGLNGSQVHLSVKRKR